MQTSTTLKDLRDFVAKSPKPLGVVPTMGALHAGHSALVKQAREECQTVVVSIFVNRIQFDRDDDFETYPRTPQADAELLEAHGVDCLFTPALQELFPKDGAARVTVGRVGDQLEGHSRPNHFTGVATIVAKLLSATKAEYAYFGAKDAQQIEVVRKVALELPLKTKIVVVPTVREADGLAFSSRNRHLKASERIAAPVLFRALSAARSIWQRGVRNPDTLKQAMLGIIAEEPLAKLDYAVIADPNTFEELKLVGNRALALVALRIGSTRLIDSELLKD